MLIRASQREREEVRWRVRSIHTCSETKRSSIPFLVNNFQNFKISQPASKAVPTYGADLVPLTLQSSSFFVDRAGKTSNATLRVLEHSSNMYIVHT